VSVQKQATIFLLVLVSAVLVTRVGGAFIQNRANGAQTSAQAAQLLQTNEKQFAIGLLNQETGERGFELTGESQYLQPYELGRDQARVARQFLDAAAIEPSTRTKLIVMEASASAWQEFASTRLAAVAVSGPSPNPSTDIEGKGLFDAFRLSESDLSSSLDATVKQQLATAQDLTAAGVAASIVGTAAILLLIALLAGIVFRSMLHPVRQLILAANALSAGEPVTIASANRSDEIGQLARSLLAWDQAAHERLELGQAMVDVDARTNLDDVLALGLRKTADALAAVEVAASLDSGLVFILNGGEHRRIDSPEGALRASP